jgi:TRAP transporter TAXI family solute receptor
MILAACGDNETAQQGDNGNNNDEANAAEGSNDNVDDLEISGGGGDGEYLSETDSYTLRFTSAGETGIYYPLGAIFSNLWTNELPNVTASSSASNGSVQNMIFMSQDEADVGLVMGSILAEAYYGEAGFEGNAYEDVRILAGIYLNYNNVVVRDGGGIESFSDVAGKRFVPGDTGSGTEIASQQIFEAYGLTFDDVNTSFVGFSEATDLMRNNQIDGTNINSGIPTAAVSEMLSTADGQLLSLDQDAIDYMTDKWDFYIDATIPAGTYPNQDEDVQTTAMMNFLVADASMPDDVAYDLVKSLWDNLEGISGSHGVIEQFEIENVQDGSGDIPFHPGAQQYYEEEGVWND